MKTTRDNEEFCEAILANLSKVFDCIFHDLVIAELNPYGFDRNVLKLISDYLNDISQKTEAGSLFSSYFDNIYGAPQ